MHTHAGVFVFGFVRVEMKRASSSARITMTFEQGAITARGLHARAQRHKSSQGHQLPRALRATCSESLRNARLQRIARATR